MTDPITTPEAHDAYESDRGVIVRILDAEGAQTGECGHDPGSLPDDGTDECQPLLEGYADAILAAGFTRPDAPTPTPAGDDQREALAAVVQTVTLGSTEGCDCDLPPARLDDDAALAVADAILAARPSAPTVTTEQYERLCAIVRDPIEAIGAWTRSSLAVALGIEVRP